MRKTAAAVIALVAWAGIAIQFTDTLGRTGSVVLALWVLLRFFTVLTNLLVAVTLGRLALGARVPPFVLGGVTIAIILVGIVNATLLHGLVELKGPALIADTLLHIVVPSAVALYWLALAPRGELKWRDPWLWCLYPLAYFIYAVARGAIDGRYPYPFIDVAQLGITRAAINALAMAIAFVASGLLLVAIDRALARRLGERTLGGGQVAKSGADRHGREEN